MLFRSSPRRCEAGNGCFSSLKEKQLMKGCIANKYHYKIICTNTAHPVICCEGDLCNLNVTLPISDKQPSKSIIRIRQYKLKHSLYQGNVQVLNLFQSKSKTLGLACTLDCTHLIIRGLYPPQKMSMAC